MPELNTEWAEGFKAGVKAQRNTSSIITHYDEAHTGEFKTITVTDGAPTQSDPIWALHGGTQNVESALAEQGNRDQVTEAGIETIQTLGTDRWTLLTVLSAVWRNGYSHGKSCDGSRNCGQ